MALGAFGGVRPATAPPATQAGRYGGQTLGRAVEGAVQYKNAMGLPSYADLFKQFGGEGEQAWGNAGAAKEGADFARNELVNWRNAAEAQRQNVAAARQGVRNPTGTEGFKSVMRLNTERAAHAADAMNQQQAGAASRRGYAGGYNPARTEQSRLESLALAGNEAALAERTAQQGLMDTEADLYRTDVGGYGQGLDAYSSLLSTYAELPTKYMSAYANLLGAMPGYGDLFGTALKGAMFEEEPGRMRMQEQADERKDARQFGYGERSADAEAARREQASVSEYERQRAAEREAQAAKYRATGRDPQGRPYGAANPGGY
jgi:hypothetical protein